MEKKQFKIIILDDSVFYNKLLTKQIEEHTEDLMYNKGCNFNIRSYIDSTTFLNNLEKDTDIAFVDYHLGQGLNGGDLIKKIEAHCLNCKIVIVSQNKNVQTVIDSVSEGSTAFIYKDENALDRVSFFLKYIANNKILA